MSSKRLRAIRNRDRSKVQAQLHKEASEPIMDDLKNDVAQDSSKVEPELNIQENLNNDNSSADKIPDEKIEVESNAAFKSAQDLESIMSVSPLEQAKSALKENPSSPLSAQVDAPVTESVAPNIQTPDLGSATETVNTESSVDSIQKAPDFSSEKKIVSNGDDDPDKIPVAPSLADNEVPNCPGAILMHAREMLGMSLSEVSRRLNLRINTVSDLEHDRLNQPTAVPFASVHIANYAKLVNIDPDYLVKLYKDKVMQTVQTQALNARVLQKSSNSGMISKKFLFAVLGIAVVAIIAVGVIAFEMGSSKAKSTGSLVIEDNVQAQEDTDGSLTLDTENSKVKTNVLEETPAPAVDINTQMAQAQANDLDTNEIISLQNQSKQSVTSANTSESLQVKGEAAKKMMGNKSESTIIEEAPPAQENSLKPVQLGTQNTQPTKKQSSNDKLALKTLPAVETDRKPVVTETPKAQVKTEPKVEAAQATKLSANLRDVSSSVRLSGRVDPLESLNSVTVKVLSDVSLKITGSGRVLKEGSFKAGQTIKVMGIPPLKVSVADPSKIRVTYRGASVSVPHSSQVTFTLPQR
jgi:cytoskeletal protein RodZ